MIGIISCMTHSKSYDASRTYRLLPFFLGLLLCSLARSVVLIVFLYSTQLLHQFVVGMEALDSHQGWNVNNNNNMKGTL